MQNNPMASVRTIKALMNKYHFSFSKGLGQNFLIDGNILGRIADEANIDKDTLVIEIGPGIGSLTYELCQRAKKVVSVELDDRLAPVLAQTLACFDNFELKICDALKTDFAAIIRDNGNPRTVVCANLPYYITTPVVMYLLESNLDVASITVMIQKEVAQRFCGTSQKGDYGAITVNASYYASCEILFDVEPTSFMPAPKVTSSVITFTRHKTVPVNPKDKALMFEVIKAAFEQRRKTLANALSNHFPSFGKTTIINAINSCGFDANVRGEKLNLAEFSDISDYLASN